MHCAAVWAATQTIKLSTTLWSISCAIRLISFLMMSSLVCGLFSQTLSFWYPLKNGNRMAWDYWFDVKWVIPWEAMPEVFKCSVREMRHYLISNPHLEQNTWIPQTDNPWPSYLQDLNPPDYFLRGCLKDRVCENNPQTRQDIITKEIRRVAQEMLHRVVDNFIVRVAAVLSYSNAVHGTNIVLLKNYSKSLLIQEWFTQKEFYKLPVSAEKKSWRFHYFFKSYCQNKIETFFWATLYTGKILFKLVVLPLLSLWKTVYILCMYIFIKSSVITWCHLIPFR